LLRSYASLGFDDHRWFSDDDLRLVCSVATVQVNKAHIAIEAARLELEKANRASPPLNIKHKQNLEKAITNREDDYAAIQRQAMPYKAEFERRGLK
jgi:hypothetical protein